MIKILKAQSLVIWILLIFFLNIGAFAGAQNYTGQAEQHYKLGEIYYERGLYQEAEKEFQKAMELFEKTKIVVSEKPELKEKQAEVAKEPQKEGIKAKKEIKPKEKLKPQKKPRPRISAAKSKVEPEKEELQAPPRRGYIISPGDVLQIDVWENPDLSQEAIVRPDGKISFPLIDEIQASGRTILELDKEITERLKEFIRYPDVSISLKSMGGSKVMVLGEVDEPGVYALTGRRTILEAISLAGGLTKDAYASSIVVIKDSLDKPKAIRISLNKAIHNPRSRQNIVLEPEDVVFVPKKFISDLLYFVNQILDPLRKGDDTAQSIKVW